MGPFCPTFLARTATLAASRFIPTVALVLHGLQGFKHFTYGKSFQDVGGKSNQEGGGKAPKMLEKHPGMIFFGTQQTTANSMHALWHTASNADACLQLICAGFACLFCVGGPPVAIELLLCL